MNMHKDEYFGNGVHLPDPLREFTTSRQEWQRIASAIPLTEAGREAWIRIYTMVYYAEDEVKLVGTNSLPNYVTVRFTGATGDAVAIALAILRVPGGSCPYIRCGNEWSDPMWA